MPKVSEEHRQSRREQILDAAIACFIERGFQGTSMADIIQESGLSAGAIYRYFPGKRDIAMAVAKHVVAAQVSGIIGRMGPGRVAPPSAFIRDLLEGLRSQRVAPSLVLQLWAEAGTDHAFYSIAQEMFETLNIGFVAYLERWAVQSGRASETDARDWAVDALQAAIGLAQGAIVQSALWPGFDLERYLVGVDRVIGEDPA